MKKSEANVTAYLYVLGCKDGPHKIGYSYRPYDRVKAMEREGREEVFVVGTYPVGVIMARAAERYAHWMLREHHLEREWFSVSRETAIAAVKKALEPDVVATYNPYNLIPPTTTPIRELKGGPYIYTRFKPGMRERLNAALDEDETQGDLIRTAVEAELERRAKAPRKPN